MPRRTPIPLLLPLAAAISVTVPFDIAQATTGDMNCCGGVTCDDVDFFVTALIDPMGYADLFPACDVILADMNGNGLEDGKDIPMFVTKLLAGESSVPADRCWDGGGDGESWSNGANWSPDGAPQASDHVYLLTGDSIMADVGSPSNPEVVASLTVHGILGGRLQIPSGNRLQINGDFRNLGDEPNERFEFTMRPQSALELVGSNGDANLIRIDVVMQPVAANGQSTLSVDGIVEGGDFRVDQNCVVTIGQEDITATSQLRGEWVIKNGGAIAIKNDMGASLDTPLHLTLEGGSMLTALEGPYGTYTTFLNDLENELIHGAGNNVLKFGAAGSDYPVFEPGFRTVFRAAVNSPSASLTMEMFGGLVIHSFFGHDFVRQGWDSRNVDIVALPIDVSVPFASQIRYDMISSNMEDSFGGNPVIFVDVPCLGSWRDLILPDAEGINAATTSITEEYNNSVTDDFFEEPSFSAVAEAGLFRDVSIGADRTLAFPTFVPGYGQVRLYFYGNRNIDDAGEVLYYAPTGPMIVTDLTDPSIDDLIVPAVGTLYGDWDGDCVITHLELTELLDRIAQKEYDPLFDYDCDGLLTSEVEVTAITASMNVARPCAD
ncbi:MAG: hypothetical protein O7F76_09415 [Planctomycetota bacterium]|nr:hypothetical protein [Planctomycetota bacterium]